jgi:hypothetical protein
MFSGVQTSVLGVGELLLRAKPAERATQFCCAVPFIGASVGHDHLLGPPGEHLLQRGAGLLLAAQERQPDFGGALPSGSTTPPSRISHA